jgi:phosphate:Na+ symporter
VSLDLVGGIGVFLLGMVLLTEGLKALGGSALRRGLARFTGGRLAAVASGAVATTLVQSSTATTMTTIGLVQARLLPFPNAVAVILGANLGTTSTAWIVAYFGLKLDITGIAFVAVAAGAAMRLLGRDRVAAAGLPVAGFGLLFVGIGIMQSAMAGLASRVDLGGDVTVGLGRLLVLVLVGAAMTIVMQSSSAAVATTLAALHAGAIGLEGAAALVIGQNIGTTPKALLAALGASAAARRTAWAHVAFNLGTGAVALLILPVFVWAATAAADAASNGGPEPVITLAAFHTLFNLVGVALVLPWLGTFARLVTRMVPERRRSLTRQLEPAVAAVPPLAVEAARATLLTCASEVSEGAASLMARPPTVRERRVANVRLQRVREALEEARTFLATVRSDPASESDHRRHVSVLHALDHLQGAVDALRRREALETLRSAPHLAAPRDHLRESLESLVAWCRGGAPTAPADEVLAALTDVAPLRRRTRGVVLRRVALGSLEPQEADESLEALALLQAFSHHVLRAVHHLREPAPGDEA